jgi:hypothetical protein
MTVELGKYMTDAEMDKCINFMDTLKDTRHDINPSVSDCATQMKILFGTERYLDIVRQWSQDNQKLLTVFGKMKYKLKDGSDKRLFDGLDPHDNPDDYEKVYT